MPRLCNRIINAASLDGAEEIAQGNPFIASIRIYEIMTGEYARYPCKPMRASVSSGLQTYAEPARPTPSRGSRISHAPTTTETPPAAA